MKGNSVPHDIIVSVAIFWIAILLAVSLVLVIVGPSLLARILAFDMVTMIIIGGLVLLSLERDSSFDLDAALMLGLIAFSGTLAVARSYREGKIFS